MHEQLTKIPRYAIYALLVFTPLARASVQPWAVTTIHLITLVALTAFLLEKALSGKVKRLFGRGFTRMNADRAK